MSTLEMTKIKPAKKIKERRIVIDTVNDQTLVNHIEGFKDLMHCYNIKSFKQDDFYYFGTPGTPKLTLKKYNEMINNGLISRANYEFIQQLNKYIKGYEEIFEDRIYISGFYKAYQHRLHFDLTGVHINLTNKVISKMIYKKNKNTVNMSECMKMMKIKFNILKSFCRDTSFCFSSYKISKNNKITVEF